MTRAWIQLAAAGAASALLLVIGWHLSKETS